VDGLYQQAMRELVTIQGCPAPQNYPLPPYDRPRLMTEMALFKEWFVAQYLGLTLSDEEIALIDNTCQHIAENVAQQPNVFVHRDYHSRNLMLVNDGVLGVIDFQDAVIGAITYDLVSLLRDAYVEWPQQRVVDWVEDFRNLLQQQGQIPQVSQAQFLAWFDYMGAQRHLKVVGIFARLSLRDGKHGYLNDIPLVFKYLLNEIKDYPALDRFISGCVPVLCLFMWPNILKRAICSRRIYESDDFSRRFGQSHAATNVNHTQTPIVCR
jgi:aminoglycoside/choline kinase family phosphotransferase